MELSYTSTWPNGMTVTTYLRSDRTADDVIDLNRTEIGVQALCLEKRAQTPAEEYLADLYTKSADGRPIGSW